MPPGVSENNPAEAIDRVLAPAFLGHLGRLRLNVRRAFGPRPGDTPVRGLVQPSGLELERHKAYDSGDELRFLDWNAYARLDQLLVRQFRAEREAPVYVFVDVSASMGVPESDGKFAFATALALALAYVAVRHHNPTRIFALGGTPTGWHTSPVVRVRARLPILSDFCAHLRPGGASDLDRAVSECVQSIAVPGYAILLSDFLLEPERVGAMLHQLAARGYEVAALRPLGVGERDPSTVFKRARVRDVESGGEKIVRLTPETLAHYSRALEDHLAALESACLDNQALFATCDVAEGLDHCVFAQLPRLGLLR